MIELLLVISGLGCGFTLLITALLIIAAIGEGREDD